MIQIIKRPLNVPLETSLINVLHWIRTAKISKMEKPFSGTHSLAYSQYSQFLEAKYLIFSRIFTK